MDLRRKAALGIIVLLCSASLLFQLQWVRAYVNRRPAIVDDIAALEARLAPLKSYYPSRGTVAYRSDQEIPPYIVQHALAPMQVSDGPDTEWLVVNFHHAREFSVQGYDVFARASTDDGSVALLRRAEP